jgi:hypothetical protein
MLEGLRSGADAMIADLRSGAEQLGRELAEIRRGLGDVSTARPEPTEREHRIREEAPLPEPEYREPEYREPEPEYRAPEPDFREPEPYRAPEPAPEPQYAAPQPEEESLKFQGDELQPSEDIPPAPDREPFVPEPEPVSERSLPDMAPPEPASTGGGGGAGSEGARLIALNMALNGTPRQETAAYLAENFDLPDQDALLDEVYSRAGS